MAVISICSVLIFSSLVMSHACASINALWGRLSKSALGLNSGTVNAAGHRALIHHDATSNFKIKQQKDLE